MSVRIWRFILSVSIWLRIENALADASPPVIIAVLLPYFPNRVGLNCLTGALSIMSSQM